MYYHCNQSHDKTSTCKRVFFLLRVWFVLTMISFYSATCSDLTRGRVNSFRNACSTASYGRGITVNVLDVVTWTYARISSTFLRGRNEYIFQQLNEKISRVISERVNDIWNFIRWIDDDIFAFVEISWAFRAASGNFTFTHNICFVSLLLSSLLIKYLIFWRERKPKLVRKFCVQVNVPRGFPFPLKRSTVIV